MDYDRLQKVFQISDYIFQSFIHNVPFSSNYNRDSYDGEKEYNLMKYVMYTLPFKKEGTSVRFSCCKIINTSY